MIRIQNCFRFS